MGGRERKINFPLHKSSFFLVWNSEQSNLDLGGGGDSRETGFHCSKITRLRKDFGGNRFFTRVESLESGKTKRRGESSTLPNFLAPLLSFRGMQFESFKSVPLFLKSPRSAAKDGHQSERDLQFFFTLALVFVHILATKAGLHALKTLITSRKECDSVKFGQRLSSDRRFDCCLPL